MATAKVLLLSTAATFIGLTMASQSDARCYGTDCNWNGTRSHYRVPGAYGYATNLYEAQSYFPNVVLSSDMPNLYMYGYQTGYRDAYGCLWLDKQCPKS